MHNFILIYLFKMSSEIEILQAEIASLTTQLEKAEADNVQAAELGLQVIKEKEQLEIKLGQLQIQYDAAKHEVETTKKVKISVEFSKK